MLLPSPPTSKPEVQMRTVRMLSALGAGVLREGVYLLPARPGMREGLAHLAAYVNSAGGSADLLAVTAIDSAQELRFRARFERTPRYKAVVETARSLRHGIGMTDISALGRVLKRQREELEKIELTDFFPGRALEQARSILDQIENEVNAVLFPQASAQAVPKELKRSDYFQKIWATREPLWADRLASAWLIKRFIDVEGHFVWIGRTDPIPAKVITFGFEGARFQNAEPQITFERIVRFFRLSDDPVLMRIGKIMRDIEKGTPSGAEGKSVETLLMGAQHRSRGKVDVLVAEAEKALDQLYDTFTDPNGAQRTSRSAPAAR